MPKLYFYDTGLACSLLGITNADGLKDHYLRGGLFESFIISEFMKSRFNAGLAANAFYWRDKTGHEVDLLLEGGRQIFLVEIKSGQTIADDYFDGLNYYNRIAGNSPENSYVIYAGRQEQKRSSGIITPWNGLSKIINNIQLV